MDISTVRKAATRGGGLMALFGLAASSRAGDFSFVPGAWSKLRTSGPAAGSEVKARSEPFALGTSLAIDARSAGTYTVKGDWSYDVSWSPSSPTDVVPGWVTVTFHCYGMGVVSNRGAASMYDLEDYDLLFEIGPSTQWESGGSRPLYDFTVTSPLVLQSDGTYKASGSLSSDLLCVRHRGGKPTSCKESFSVADIVPFLPGGEAARRKSGA